jgi:hypothetical protein
MEIVDLGGVHYAGTLLDLEKALKVREAGKNSFWLAHDQKKFPAISIVVAGGMAAVFYVPSEDDAGFVSVGDAISSLPHDRVRFSISQFPAGDIEVPDDSIVAFEEAVAVAKEFFLSRALPTSIRWRRL